jgi:2-methylcitrate dehydratase PrpD
VSGGAPPAAVLAEFAAGVSLDDLDHAIVEKAKLHILDTLGAGIAGMCSPEAQAAAEALAAADPDPRLSPIWGTPLAAPPATAALVNGVAAHALELDDTDGCDHSGAVVVPTLIAALRHAPEASGADVVRAAIVGYDVARRVLDASGGHPVCNGIGWHSTGTCGSFGAAAAAATLLGLPPAEHASALGLAGTFTGGLWAFIEDGAMAKRLHAGKAAEQGLTAALLARQGFTGSVHIFEAPWGGYFSTYLRDAAVPEALTAELGRSWKIMQASFKPYASCRDTHSAIDAAIEWRSTGTVASAELALLELRVNEFIGRMCGGRDLETTVDVQMSLPYCVAAALVHGGLGIPEISREGRADAETIAVLEKVRVVVDETLPQGAPVQVRAELRDGSVVTAIGKPPLGSIENPLSVQQVTDKFAALAGRVLPAGQLEQLLELVMALEQVPDARRLVALLRGSELPSLLD